MNTKTAAYVFGAVFTLVGLMGFVPALTPDGEVLGLFKVDTLHNIVHLSSGLLGLALASMGGGYAKKYLLGFGAVYALVTVIGLVQGDTILGLFVINSTDNLLHIGLTAGLLGSGLLLPEADAKA